MSSFFRFRVSCLSCDLASLMSSRKFVIVHIFHLLFCMCYGWKWCSPAFCIISNVQKSCLLEDVSAEHPNFLFSLRKKAERKDIWFTLIIPPFMAHDSKFIEVLGGSKSEKETRKTYMYLKSREIKEREDVTSNV